ncbi:longevity assurance proteins LAG1/LAC1 [Rickenella mellea]|uniref:Longevity assurance proteins LAG1/LAC1 n=1 Tax=Rickenella mellea TaxID=50990 RepID=A0A4R5XEK0_9AGAM|nr:longevity assurance proteins LAG1/LAC1 [Rickenella mellea]
MDGKNITMHGVQALQWLPSYMVPFFTLSYPTTRPSEPDSFPTSNYYDIGLLDACFIIGCIAVMAILRDATRLGIMEPFARWYLSRKFARDVEAKCQQNGTSNGAVNGNANGHGLIEKPADSLRRKKREEKLITRSVLRFAEQGWSVIYYTCQWSYGLYIHINLPVYPFDPDNLWIGFPHTPLSGPLKFYYLTQLAFYMHQILILNAEARRKDHVQMMTHHVITIALIIASYNYNCTRIGCLIMVLMDWCDIFLPLAKMLKYIGFNTLCDATFTWFLLSWLVTRHILFMRVIWAAFMHTPYLRSETWAQDRTLYLSYDVWVAFIVLLVALQIIQMIWFWMICRVAWKVISGQGAEDTRSDDEDFPEEVDGATEIPIPQNSDLKRRR